MLEEKSAFTRLSHTHIPHFHLFTVHLARNDRALRSVCYLGLSDIVLNVGQQQWFARQQLWSGGTTSGVCPGQEDPEACSTESTKALSKYCSRQTPPPSVESDPYAPVNERAHTSQEK